MAKQDIKDLEAELALEKAMLGEYVSRMNPILGDSDPVNAYLNDRYEECEAAIDRLERTLAVRKA